MIEFSRVIVVMGVSGCGKSTVAAALAQHLAWPFLEADDLHTPSNLEKLHAGIALEDADRAPWLAAIGQWIDARLQASQSGVIACSALRRRYREQLAAHHPALRFLYLRASETTLALRLAHRQNHFMSPRLLHSQFRTLEDPSQEANVDVIDVDDVTLDQMLAAALEIIQGDV